MKKLTNEIFDQKINNRSIIRLGNYIDNNTLISFQCLKELCGYIWSARPANILRGRGCPKCSGHLPLSNAIIDERLIGRFIIRLDDCIKSSVKIRFECLTCNYIWKTTPNHILNSESGCPRCSGKEPLTDFEIDTRIANKNIKRLDPYINRKTKMNWKCLLSECGYIWSAVIKNIIYNDAGCPKCAGNAPLNDYIIDERLLLRLIKRIDHYINIMTPIHFQCLIDTCSNIWLATPNNILNGRGCPKCNSPGYNEKIILDILNNYSLLFYYNFNIKNIDSHALYNYKLDFYFPGPKIAIEYNGKQHYEPSTFGHLSYEEASNRLKLQQERDLFMDNFCKINGIKIIWIDGRDYYFNKLQTHIENILKWEGII